MEFEILETERLFLRKLTPEIYKFVFESYNEGEIKDFFGFQTEDDFQKEKLKYKGGFTTHRITMLQFQIIPKENPVVIGHFGYHNWYPLHQRSEIGYSIKNENERGKGYMTEALKLIIPYGFNELNLNRIEALVSPDNKASIRILQKFNFTFEGLLHSHYFLEGHFVDSAIYSLLKAEFKK